MKDNFDIFNKIDMDFSEYEEIPFNNEEKNNLKKSLKKRIFKTKKINKNIIAATLAITILGGGLLSNDTVIASIKNNINNIGESLEKYISNDSKRQVNLEPYTTVVGRTIEDKGIAVTLEEVIVDTDNIYIRTTIDFSKVDMKKNNELYDYSVNPWFTIKVNGNISDSGSISETHIGDGIVSRIGIYNINDLKLNEDSSDINVSIDYNKINISTYKKGEYFGKRKSTKSVKGNWDFNFTVNVENMIKNSKVFNFNDDNEVVLNDCKFNVTRVSVNPISLAVSYKTTELKKETFPNFKVIDEFGNELSWNSKYENQDNTGKMEFKIEKESSKFTVIPGTSDYHGNYIYDENKKFEINIK